jgi:hypothetical protein
MRSATMKGMQKTDRTVKCACRFYPFPYYDVLHCTHDKNKGRNRHQHYQKCRAQPLPPHKFDE